MARSRNNKPVDSTGNAAAGQLADRLSAFFLRGLNSGSGRLRWCVALSGGRDSVVLLHALSRMATDDLPLTLTALHVHHGISPNADAWADFCRRFCEQLNVPLEIVRVDVPRDSGEGLEAAARRQRHAVFAKVDADALALAHHRDDQSETVLLNLLRGAGIAGAAGMLAVRPQASGPALIRPLLDTPRSLIEAYAEACGLAWIDDESNDDTHFRRNFLRRDILPRLDEKFPGARQSLARAAAHFAEGAGLLDELAALDFAALATPDGRLGLAGVNALTPARARNLLRYAWVAAGFRAPETRWIDEALKQLAETAASSETCLATPDGELHVYRGEVHIVPHRPPVPHEPLPWRGEETLDWAGGKVRFEPQSGGGFRRSLLDEGGLFLQPRLGGERLQPYPKCPRRNLRNLLQEAGIPPWERERLPYLWQAGKLVWVGGLGVDQAYVCAPGEVGVMPVWLDCAAFGRHFVPMIGH